MRWLRLWNREAHGFLAAYLCCRITQRLALSFDRSAANECFDAFAREGRHGCRERAVKAPPGMGGIKPNIDRSKSPHPQTDMGILKTVFNVAALARAETLPHQRLA